MKTYSYKKKVYKYIITTQLKIKSGCDQEKYKKRFLKVYFLNPGSLYSMLKIRLLSSHPL